jgi:hypothetical protein
MRASCRNRAPVETGCVADYHLRMTGDATSELRVIERAGPARRVVLRADAAGGADLWVLGGFEGRDLPAALGRARLGPLGGDRYRIASGQGNFDFSARAVDRIEMRPILFEALHRPFALGVGDRLAARALLALLRMPGGAKLLRLWHARRSK